MTAEIPDAVLSENSLAHAIESGSITPGDLGSLASHLDALVASNVASTQLMVDRHHNTAVAELCPASSSWQDFLGFECRGGGVGQAQVHLLGPVP